MNDCCLISWKLLQDNESWGRGKGKQEVGQFEKILAEYKGERRDFLFNPLRTQRPLRETETVPVMSLFQLLVSIFEYFIHHSHRHLYRSNAFKSDRP